MSPQPISEPRFLSRHPQRPWRPIDSQPRRHASAAVRTFSVAVVRELPARAAEREPAGTW